MKLKNGLIRQQILDAARQEFLDKGFRDASLRSIAAKANGTTGMIYTYFKNKNQIFQVLIQPLLDRFEQRLDDDAHPLNRPLNQALHSSNMTPELWFTRNFRFLMDLVVAHPREMRLLFLKADGSAFQDYEQTLIRRGTQRSVAAFRELKRNPAFEGETLSEFFVQTLVQYVISATREIVKQEKSKDDIRIYEKEITAFLFSGWKALVQF